MTDRFAHFTAAISSIHNSLMKIQRTEMEKYGLKGPHAECLLMLAKHPQGITAARLCALCEKDKAAISRTLAELEAAGMLNRQDPRGKNYRTQLTLTEKGREVAENVNTLVHRAVSLVSQDYDVQTREIFIHVLGLIAGNLQKLCREGLETEEKE